MDKFSYISNAHPEFLENLYQRFKNDPSAVEDEFRKFFEGFEFASLQFSENGSTAASISTDEFKVVALIEAYRNKGHLLADTNPVRERKNRKPHLDLANFGLNDADLKKEFVAGEIIGIGKKSLSAIVDHLKRAYCGGLGFQYNYIRVPEEIKWLRSKIEQNPNFIESNIDKKKKILRKLNQAVVFEQFLGKKYIGEKRFSLEGGETAIPFIDTLINVSAENGTKEAVIGMAHRGRLNILANIMEKTYEEIFSEFEGNEPDGSTMGDGDVKYHLGFSSNFKTDSGKEVYLKLAPNPSHLEAVDPIVLGYSRAKADLIYESEYDSILPIIIHGDAAVAGQGIVYEILQMSGLPGYYTGGTIHFVINNQIGFTTNFDDARTSDYCASIAQTINAPIIQVNGDDIEAVMFAAEMAAEYRQKFNKDIFIDMVCYRKHGHNESDDPKYTQPVLYKKIAKHKNPRDLYIDKLTALGEIEAKLAMEMDREFRQMLQEKLDEVKEQAVPYSPQKPDLAWKELKRAVSKDFDSNPKTGITKAQAKKIVEALIKYPEDFQPLKKVQKYLDKRREMMKENKSVDWAAAELMAYGSLLIEGHDVRMSGQDVKRGTFSHRHAVLYDERNEDEFNRLNHISRDQGKFRIYNSHLSEYGVLGFEYGYSMGSPQSLTIWEAQFGDFFNNTQTIVDQFIVSAESKWGRTTGLVLLLPHGYEGQGPEHSSARLERWLQSCAEFNIVVTNVTDSANFFHLIRRQLKWNFRKPLINMSPKSLLRHPKVQSPIEDILSGSFRGIIDDASIKDAKKVRRVLCCTGKVFFDLQTFQEENKIDDVAIVRFEQLYPLQYAEIEKIKKKYGKAEFVWVQEEPANMGAWAFILLRFRNEIDFKLVARKTSASPATGYKKQHLKEQEAIVKQAFEK